MIFLKKQELWGLTVGTQMFENFDLLDEVEVDPADFEDSKELDDFYLDAYSDYVFGSEFVRSQLLKNLLTTSTYGTLNSSIGEPTIKQKPPRVTIHNSASQCC